VKGQRGMDLWGDGPVERRMWRTSLIAGQRVRWRGSKPPRFGSEDLALVDEAPELGSGDLGLPPSKGRSAAKALVTAIIPCHRGPPVGMGALREQGPILRTWVLSNGEGGPTEVAGAEVFRVPWLGHGDTRQAAVERVETPFVLFLSDDALPRGQGWLDRLLGELEETGADAVNAWQVPWPDVGPTERLRLRTWGPRGSGWASQADHVACLHRTELLRDHPLPSVSIAEDAWWSRAGRRIWQAGGAPVVHAHGRHPVELFRRERAIHEELVAMGRPFPVPGLSPHQGGMARGAAEFSAFLAGFVSGVRDEGLSEGINRLAEQAGQWLGARAGGRRSGAG
jgi:hypothetical protein